MAAKEAVLLPGKHGFTLYFGKFDIIMFFKKFWMLFLDRSVELSKKKRLVRLAVLSGWHYQNQLYPVVEIGCDRSIIISFLKIFFQFYFERLFKII